MDGKENYDACTLFSRLLQDRQEMQQLLSSLRDTQNFCTDSHCMDELSLFHQDDDHMSTFFFIMLFVVVTMLFSIASKKLRNSKSSNKERNPENSPFGNNPRPGDDDNGRGAQAM